MELENSREIKIQIYLNPEGFFSLLNSGKDIESIELNERNKRRYHHRIKYNGTVFVTDTKTEVYEE